MVTASTNTVPPQLLEEIRLIPQDKLPELTRFVHIFRLGLEAAAINHTKQNPQDSKAFILPFAGAWEDMPDSEFQAFLDEIAERRRNAFSGRPSRETMFD